MFNGLQRLWSRLFSSSQLGSAERRSDFRVAAVVPLFFRILHKGNETYPGIMRDVSATGANFLSSHSVNAAERIHIGVLSRNGRRAVELAARVVYCLADGGGYSIGCVFDHTLEASTLSILAGSDPEASSPEILLRQLSDPDL